MLLSYSLDESEFMNHDKKSIQLVLPASQVNSFELVINNPEITADVVVDILDSLLKNCSRMYFIEFSLMTHGEPNTLKFGWYPDVCNMRMHHSSRFLELKARKHLTSGSFKYVSLSRVTLTSTVFKKIMDLLPDTKLLTMSPCRVIPIARDTTYLDLSGVNHLDELDLELNNRYMPSLYQIVVHLENVSSQHTSHYCLSRRKRQTQHQPCKGDVDCFINKGTDHNIIIKYQQMNKLAISVGYTTEKDYIYPK